MEGLVALMDDEVVDLMELTLPLRLRGVLDGLVVLPDNKGAPTLVGCDGGPARGSAPWVGPNKGGNVVVGALADVALSVSVALLLPGTIHRPSDPKLLPSPPPPLGGKSPPVIGKVPKDGFR